MADFIVISGNSKKDLLKKINKAKGNVAVRVSDEEQIRFVLEKTSVLVVLGSELVNLKDSVHFVRGGLDQITCKIAAAKGKTIGFSFNDILNTKNRGVLLARMRLNIKLCKKYGVKIIFGNFSEHSKRSPQDLTAFWRMLSKDKIRP
jgi:RNase P/RNase MRP subunit p30